MAETRDWFDMTNLALSGCTFVATVAIAWFVQDAGTRSDHAKDVSSHYQTCYTNQFSLDEAICHGSTCKPASAERLTQLTYFYQQVKKYCGNKDKDLNIEMSPYLENALNHAAGTASKSTSVETRASTAKAFGVTAPASPPTTTLPPLQPPPATAKASAPDSAPQLYIQISSPDQKSAAKALVKAVNGVPFMGSTLQAFGPDPKYTAVSSTQIRCTKASDCAHAQDLALYLGQVLGQTVRVNDVSRAYELKTEKYGPRFELWIAPGPVTVVAPGGIGGTS